MIRAYEIQGVLALENAFNRVGLDHVLLVRVASTAVVTRMLGGTQPQVIDALSNAWLDGGRLRTYRHAPNTGSRKSWAAGDATSRAVRLALWTRAGEMGYPTALTAPTWGFQDSLFRGQTVKLARPLGSYVMENILFKVSFPAEFHGQTAVEAALRLHPQVRGRWDASPASRSRPRNRPCESSTSAGRWPIRPTVTTACSTWWRSHCCTGTLTAEHYQDRAAANPRIDRLREKMEVVEEPRYSRDYLDPEKRSIANAVQVVLRRRQPDRTHRGRISAGTPPAARRSPAGAAGRSSAAMRQPGFAEATVTGQTCRTLFDESGRLGRDAPISRISPWMPRV